MSDHRGMPTPFRPYLEVVAGLALGVVGAAVYVVVTAVLR